MNKYYTINRRLFSLLLDDGLKRFADIKRGFQLFYVYAHDLVNNTNVGDAEAELLRVMVPYLNKNTSTTTSRFYYYECESLEFIPLKLATTEIRTLTVEIKDELGRLIEFDDSDKENWNANLQFHVIED